MPLTVARRSRIYWSSQLAGHYLLRNIGHLDLALAQAAPRNLTWSGLQHAAVGWTAVSRAILINVFNGVPIPNRNGLPPHRYLGINAANPVVQYLRGANWVGEPRSQPRHLGWWDTDLINKAGGGYQGGAVLNLKPGQASPG